MTTSNNAVTNFSLFSPNKFQIVINKFPGVTFFAQSCPVPGITLGTTKMYTNQPVDYNTPGDKLIYDDLVIEFLIDEDLVSYTQLKDWMYSEASSELNKGKDRFSDIEVIALTNNQNPNKSIVYKNSFPFGLTELPMDTRRSEDDPITCTATFKYSDFIIKSTV